MRLTDLGFLFLLMPIAAAAYYCFPKKLKPFALFTVSTLFFYMMEPRYIWLTISAAVDCLFVSQLDDAKPRTARDTAVARLCVIKNIAVMLVFGVALPLLYSIQTPLGVMVISLSSMELVVYRMRDDFHSCEFFEAAGAVTFFGSLVHGPVSCAQSTAAQLKALNPSITKIARGVMLLACGIAKRVILAEQLFALFKTISRIPAEQYSLGLGWLCALCGALGIYFTLSAYSDIAQGLGGIFSLKLPRIVYYPFQARNIREYVYRLNIPLEDSVGRMMFTNIRREDRTPQGYAVSLLMPFLLAMFISPTGGFLLWAGYLSGVVLLDWILLHRLPAPVVFFSRAATFLITLPSYVLLLPVSLKSRLIMLSSMAGLGGVPLYNDDFIYLSTSNFFLLAAGVIFCTNILDMLSRATEKQFPSLWWIMNTAIHIGIMILATSFLIWNVR